MPSPQQQQPPPAFDWERRMGEHFAFHTSAANNVLHAVCIPGILLGALHLLRQIPMPLSRNLAVWVILGAGVCHVQTEPLIGSTYTVALWGLYRFAEMYLPSTSIGICGGLLLLITCLETQVQVGHPWFEPHGRDDTKRNVAEFQATKNPIFILLVFYYHWAHVWFLLGYRPRLYARIQAHTARMDDELCRQEEVQKRIM